MTSVKLFDEPAMVRALSHPLRARILRLLRERRASPRELAEELDQPLGNVSYHVRTLVDLKLVKLVRRVPRRGTIEHYYEAAIAPELTDAAWGASSPVVKQAMVASVLNEIGIDAFDAASLGGFDAADAHLTRSELVLDAKGWHELAEELLTILRRSEEIEAESKKRLEASNHEGERTAGLVMLFFDRVRVPKAPPSKDTRRKSQEKPRRARA